MIFAIAAITRVAACEGKLGFLRTLKINVAGGLLYGAVRYNKPSPLKDGELLSLLTTDRSNHIRVVS